MTSTTSIVNAMQFWEVARRRMRVPARLGIGLPPFLAYSLPARPTACKNMVALTGIEPDGC